MTENVTCIKWDRSCLRWEIPYRDSCNDRGLGSSRVFNNLPAAYWLDGPWSPVELCFGVDGRKIVGTEDVIPDGRGRITGGPGAIADPSGALVLVGSITRVAGTGTRAIAAPSGALVSVGSVTRAAGTGFTRFCADGESGEFGVSAFAGLSSFL